MLFPSSSTSEVTTGSTRRRQDQVYPSAVADGGLQGVLPGHRGQPLLQAAAPAQCGVMRAAAHTLASHHTKPAPRVAVSALGRAHIRPQSSVAPHPAPRAPAGPRHGHAGRGLHRGDRDQDQRLPRHRAKTGKKSIKAGLVTSLVILSNCALFQYSYI